ncbi:hypothetical protein ACLPHM_04270 [Paenalcaligenes sp. Me131]|uniref:hypothetical protein n=1 Tax=Paenalcaligenes sp. Me131 TaxID=3392636 RepID=UPI003D2D037B
MQIAIFLVVVCGAALVAPILLSVAVALLAIVLWKVGKARVAMQMAFIVAAAVLTYWVSTITALMLATSDAYVMAIAVVGAAVVAIGVFWALFRKVVFTPAK